MPTKKSIKHHAGAVARAKRAVKKAERKLSYSQLEAQIALLEEQIALLKGEGAGDFPKGIGKFSQGDREKGSIAGRTGTPGSKAAGSGNREDVKTETLSPITYSLSPPVLAVPTTAGDSVFLRWSEVAGADYIEIELAYDAAFTERAGGMSVDGSRTWATLPEMPPDKTWFIHVRALGSDASMSSAWSNARSVRTPPEGMAGTSDEIVTHLQSWLEQQQTEFQNFAALVPQLENTVLTTGERRRLLGSGVRRYGFIEKVLDVSSEYPQFWPASVDVGDTLNGLRERVRAIEVLRNLLAWQRFVSRVTGDLLLLAGDDAFRTAGMYYSTLRSAARNNLPEAQQLYQLLNLFWRRRRTNGEPTEHELERDFKRLIHGKVDGTVLFDRSTDVIAKHESPKPVLRPNNAAGGVHEVIDNVHSAKCRVKNAQ